MKASLEKTVVSRSWITTDQAGRGVTRVSERAQLRSAQRTGLTENTTGGQERLERTRDEEEKRN